MAQREQRLCTYNGGSCLNERAMGRRGRRLVGLCTYHRRRARIHQKAYLLRQKMKKRRRLRLDATASVVSPVSVATAPLAPTPASTSIVMLVVPRGTNVAAAIQRFLDTSGRGEDQLLAVVSSDSLEDTVRSVIRGPGDDTSAAARPYVTPVAHAGPEQSEMIGALNLEPLLDTTGFEPLLSAVDHEQLLDSEPSLEALDFLPSHDAMVIDPFLDAMDLDPLPSNIQPSSDTATAFSRDVVDEPLVALTAPEMEVPAHEQSETTQTMDLEPLLCDLEPLNDDDAFPFVRDAEDELDDFCG